MCKHGVMHTQSKKNILFAKQYVYRELLMKLAG